MWGGQLAISATGRERISRQERKATSSSSLLPWGLIAAFKASLNKSWKFNSLVTYKTENTVAQPNIDDCILGVVVIVGTVVVVLIVEL